MLPEVLFCRNDVTDVQLKKNKSANLLKDLSINKHCFCLVQKCHSEVISRSHWLVRGKIPKYSNHSEDFFCFFQVNIATYYL